MQAIFQRPVFVAKRQKDEERENTPKVTEKHFLGSQESGGVYRQVTMKEMKGITNQGQAQRTRLWSRNTQNAHSAWH